MQLGTGHLKQILLASFAGNVPAGGGILAAAPGGVCALYRVSTDKQEGQQRFDSHTDKLTNYIRFWQADGESEKTSIRT